jgi:hypothetical protein
MALRVGGERALGRDRAEQRTPRARERDHEPVTHRLHFESFMRCDLLAN